MARHQLAVVFGVQVLERVEVVHRRTVAHDQAVLARPDALHWARQRHALCHCTGRGNPFTGSRAVYFPVHESRSD